MGELGALHGWVPAETALPEADHAGHSEWEQESYIVITCFDIFKTLKYGFEK